MTHSTLLPADGPALRTGTLLATVAVFVAALTGTSPALADEAAGDPVVAGATTNTSDCPQSRTWVNLWGDYDSYKAWAEVKMGGSEFGARALLGSRLEQIGDFPVDAAGTLLETDLLADVLIRIHGFINSGPTLLPWFLQMEVEGDVLSGAVSPGPELEGSGYPYGRGFRHDLRKVLVIGTYAGYLGLTGGLTTDHWGLGLLYNDGDHGWRPGNASFADPRDGDRVMRGMLFTGPHTDMSFVASIFADRIWADELLFEGDDSYRFGANIRLGSMEDNGLGLLGAWRRHLHGYGAVTEIATVDATGSLRFDFGTRTSLHLQAEVVGRFGTHEYGPSGSQQELDLLQFGGALRANLDFGSSGVLLDTFFTSGDGDPADTEETAFRADPNFEQGLLLYRWVLAAQTGRARHTLAESTSPGAIAPNPERAPTRGSITGSVGIFPRVWWRPVDGLELYGGALLAIATDDLADPVATAAAGDGTARNALGGKPGSLMGVEIDAGLRYRFLIWGVEGMLGLEAGMLIPGGAFDDSEGRPMAPLFGGRSLFTIRV